MDGLGALALQVAVLIPFGLRLERLDPRAAISARLTSSSSLNAT